MYIKIAQIKRLPKNKNWCNYDTIRSLWSLLMFVILLFIDNVLLLIVYYWFYLYTSLHVGPLCIRSWERLWCREDPSWLFLGLVTRYWEHYSSFSIIDPQSLFSLGHCDSREPDWDRRRYRYRATRRRRHCAAKAMKKGEEKSGSKRSSGNDVESGGRKRIIDRLERSISDPANTH